MHPRPTRSLLVALAVLTGGAIAAQQKPQQGAVVMKGRAPVSTNVLKVTLPRPVETDLSSGLHVMVLEDHRVPMVSFQIQILGAGGYFDPADQVGLAQVTASMMREGTATRTTSQISEMLETKAATVGVGASLSSNAATVSGSSLTEQFGETLALAADILLHPTFPQEEMEGVVPLQPAQRRLSMA